MEIFPRSPHQTSSYILLARTGSHDQYRSQARSTIHEIKESPLNIWANQAYLNKRVVEDWHLVKKNPEWYHSIECFIIQMINLTFILDNISNRAGIQILMCLISKSVPCHLLALNVKKFFLYQDVLDLVRNGFTEEKSFRQDLEGNYANGTIMRGWLWSIMLIPLSSLSLLYKNAFRVSHWSSEPFCAFGGLLWLWWPKWTINKLRRDDIYPREYVTMRTQRPYLGPQQNRMFFLRFLMRHAHCWCLNILLKKCLNLEKHIHITSYHEIAPSNLTVFKLPESVPTGLLHKETWVGCGLMWALQGCRLVGTVFVQGLRSPQITSMSRAINHEWKLGGGSKMPERVFGEP